MRHTAIPMPLPRSLGNNYNLKQHRISGFWLWHNRACNLRNCEKFLQTLRIGESWSPETQFEVTAHLVQRAAQAGVLDMEWFCYKVLTWEAYQKWMSLADKQYQQEAYNSTLLPVVGLARVKQECLLRAFLHILKEGDSRYATEQISQTTNPDAG